MPTPLPNSALSCPVCSEPDAALTGPAGRYRLYRCRICDLTFSDPMQAPGSEWYEGAYLIRHIAVDDRIREYFRWALNRLPPACRLLDVGCGEGTFVAYARGRGFDAWGVDFSRTSVEAGARRYGLTTLRVGAIEALRAAGPGFQAVTAFEVLEHVESPVTLLRTMRDALLPGGDLALSVPNRDRWPLQEFSDYPPNHLTRWSEPALRRAAEEADLRVVAIEQTSRLQSINALFGYVPRSALYWALGLRSLGIAPRSNAAGRMLDRSPVLGRFGSAARRARDAVLWPPALLAAPFLWHRCRGYNLMLHARRPE